MLLSALVFAAVLVLVILKPKGLNEAWPAFAGAVILLALGAVSWADVRAVGSMVWNATLALIAVILISAVLDAAGFFQWAALSLAYRTGGSGRRLFYLVAGLSALVTIFFNNDGSVLILTPIVYSLMVNIQMERASMLPFLVAAGYLADAASVPLVVSNLVNILTSDYGRVSFAKYAAYMAVPGVIGIVAAIVVLRIYYRKELPRRFMLAGLPLPKEAIVDPFVVKAGLVILGLVVTGYFAGGVIGVPVSIIAAFGAAVLTGLALYRKSFSVRRVIRQAPWHIVLFAFGMYLIVHSLNRSGLQDLVAGFLRPHARSDFRFLLMSGFELSALSGILNNLPATLTANSAMAAIGEAVGSGVKMAAVIIAGGIGCKLTPIGSLATLLWIHVLSQKGFAFSWKEYLRVGLVVTPLVLVVTLLGAYAWLRLIGLAG